MQHKREMGYVCMYVYSLAFISERVTHRTHKLELLYIPWKKVKINTH